MDIAGHDPRQRHQPDVDEYHGRDDGHDGCQAGSGRRSWDRICTATLPAVSGVPE